MSETSMLIATLGEFIAWYNAGELRCSPLRIFSAPLDDQGLPAIDLLREREMLSMAPFVDLEEEHNLLVAKIEIDQNSFSFGDPSGLFKNIVLPISALRGLHPISGRGGRLLASRLTDYAVRLDNPIAERSFERLWNDWSWRRSLRGGDELLDTMVANRSFQPSDQFKFQINQAIAIANKHDAALLCDADYVSNLICYDRHDPIPNSDIGYFADLGVLIKQWSREAEAQKPIVDALRNYFKANSGSLSSLAGLLVSGKYKDLNGLYATHLGGDLPLCTALLFLKWKYQNQKAGKIQFDELNKSVAEANGLVPKADIEKALWVYGAYCGFDQMARDIYLRRSEKYFFTSDRVDHKPCVLKDPEAVVEKNDAILATEPRATQVSPESQASTPESSNNAPTNAGTIQGDNGVDQQAEGGSDNAMVVTPVRGKKTAGKSGARKAPSSKKKNAPDENLLPNLPKLDSNEEEKSK